MSKFKESLNRLTADADANLKDYFTETEAVRELADFSSNKIIAVGLKGIGKTSTFRYFTEMQPDREGLVIGINSRLYKLFLPTVGMNYAACQSQFEHDLVIEALRGISESKAMERIIGREHVRRAKAQVSSYKEVLGTAAGMFRGVSILGCGFTIDTRQSKVLVGLRPNEEVQESFDVLKRACEAGAFVRIVVDDPELVFSVSQELDVHLIGGFFLAALNISQQIPRCKILALTKTHVFYPIDRNIEDFDKYPDCRVDLSWSRQELVDLIDKRMQWSGTDWSQVFAISEKKARTFLAEKVCDSIRNGPRDLLHWVDLALGHAKNAKISEADFEAARKEMAKYSLKSLGQSFEALYPKIVTVLTAIFRHDPRKSFTLEELRRHLEALLATDPTMKNLANSPWMQEETHFTLPELLFRVGSLALVYGKRLILPYEKEYDMDHFHNADSLRLVPAVVEAI